MPIVLVTSLHAGVIAQSQEILKWFILEVETDGKCEKNYWNNVLLFDKNDTQSSAVFIQHALFVSLSYSMSKDTHKTSKIW
jgi:hypothetical protein